MPTFKRITVNTQYLSEIDGLRFLAILPVIFIHLGTFYLRNNDVTWSVPLTQDPLYLLRRYCEIGVPIFYCLSGFILSMPFGREILQQKKKVSIKQFYGRRLTRLEPPYVIALTTFFFVHLIILKAPFWDTFQHYLASLFYLHTLIYGEWSSILPVAWTLEIEVQFYLLAPFLARFFFTVKSTFRRIFIVLLICAFAAIELYFLDALKPFHLDKTLLTKAHYFLSGILLCDFFISENSFFKSKTRLWDLVFVIGFFSSAAIRIAYGEGYYLDKMVFTVSLVLMFLAGFKGTMMNKVFTNPWVYLTGGMCYTLYLLHYPFFFFTGTFVGVFQATNIFAFNIIIQMLWNIPLLALIAVPFYLLIERPCMDRLWPQKLWAVVQKRLRLNRG